MGFLNFLVISGTLLARSPYCAPIQKTSLRAFPILATGEEHKLEQELNHG